LERSEQPIEHCVNQPSAENGNHSSRKGTHFARFESETIGFIACYANCVVDADDGHDMFVNLSTFTDNVKPRADNRSQNSLVFVLDLSNSYQYLIHAQIANSRMTSIIQRYDTGGALS
jgi:hypothetical protein